MSTGSGKLGNLRVLIVEDESLIAMLIEDAVLDLGCRMVTIAATLRDALDQATSGEFDIAILDVNLNGSPAFPVAELLADKRIPFIFSTGYGASGVPQAFAAVPVLAKPFKEGDVARAIETAMEVNGRGGVAAGAKPAS